MSRRRVPLLVVAAGSVAVLAACGSQGISSEIASQPENVQNGARIFAERCSGCHNLDVAGAEGGALKVKNRERTDGPNFNVRKEDRNAVLYALRNGGFSGAIMPENIVVGNEAQDVAAFLAKYAGRGENALTAPAQSSPGPQPGSQPPASQGDGG
ncbi:MAG TPA: c-type cytochrome [Solirubrobacteraceae bacterium]|nr:c-type cytochrome [Solirubrobacteraceae bacterium]